MLRFQKKASNLKCKEGKHNDDMQKRKGCFQVVKWSAKRLSERVATLQREDVVELSLPLT